VMYHDPGQLAAKRRLMALFENETDEADTGSTADEEEGDAIAIPGENNAKARGKKAVPVRRSTRMAGF